METKQTPTQTRAFLAEKNTGLLYSLYLTIGSVSLFASMVALNTAYQGFIWSYSTRYIINSFTLAFALFISGAFLIIACVRLVQEKQSARVFGFAGIGFLVAYSLFILVIDRYIAYTLVYVLMLLVLFALIVAVALVFIHKKRR
jgi:uncharacterized membrane protein